MDRLKFSTIAHHHHVFYNPLSEEKANRLIELLEFTTVQPVLDIGCGKAELLIRICKRHGVQGVGVDINPTFVQMARTNAQKRLSPHQITFVEQPMTEFNPPDASFAGAMCIGSSHAYGSYRATLRACLSLVSSGGFVLMGEGYWRQEPHPDYLAFLGATAEDSGFHAQNVQMGMEEGLVPLYSTVSNQDEWDHYEGLYNRAVERYVYTHPEDPQALAMRERIRQWREMYLKHGRSTLGFGFYLFQKP